MNQKLFLLLMAKNFHLYNPSPSLLLHFVWVFGSLFSKYLLMYIPNIVSCPVDVGLWLLCFFLVNGTSAFVIQTKPWNMFVCLSLPSCWEEYVPGCCDYSACPRSETHGKDHIPQAATGPKTEDTWKWPEPNMYSRAQNLEPGFLFSHPIALVAREYNCHFKLIQLYAVFYD
jgi:hypothetical protein